MDRYYNFYAHFITKSSADNIFEDLPQEIGQIEQKQVKVFGKVYDEPRLSQVFGTKKYRYSRVLHEPQSFTPTMIILLDMLEEQFGIRYNTIVYNFYENGDKNIGEHSDDEPEIDQSKGIISLSFGAERKFQLRTNPKRTDIPVEKVVLKLGHGSCLVMKPGCQERYVHKVPKETAVQTPRINLTFRVLK